MAWKKREMRLKSQGYYDLAKEVVKQWSMDGKPKSDFEGVKLWAELLIAHKQQMNTGFKCHAQL